MSFGTDEFPLIGNKITARKESPVRWPGSKNLEGVRPPSRVDREQ